MSHEVEVFVVLGRKVSLACSRSPESVPRIELIEQVSPSDNIIQSW